jgi:hypothetical protein
MKLNLTGTAKNGVAKTIKFNEDESEESEE